MGLKECDLCKGVIDDYKRSVEKHEYWHTDLQTQLDDHDAKLKALMKTVHDLVQDKLNGI